MARSIWRIPMFGLVLASLGLVGGTAVGGELGPLAAGYGGLIAFTAAYAFIGLAIRERAWRRLARIRGAAALREVAGHRLF
jgi:hypothetical protein